MNCGLYRNGLIEIARGGQPEKSAALHLAVCEDCQEFLATQQRVSLAMRGVSAAAPAALPEGLERVLLAEFDAARRVALRPRRFWFAGGAFAMTAAAVVAIVLSRIPKQKPQAATAVSNPASVAPTPVVQKPPVARARPVTMPPRPQLGNAAVHVPAPAATQEPTFVSIPFTTPLAPNERADVVRMDVPVAALIAAGLPLRVQDMGASASADVLVGEDGRARAVRLLSIADTSSDRRFR
ncbi:MAG: hypothetical protein JWN34_4945 [Bryobacterales bacterium]|nr:hypothetical protein [Bryobacterales bacterium]